MESVYPLHFYVIPEVCGVDRVWVYMDEIQYVDFYIFNAVMFGSVEVSGYIIILLVIDAP